MAKRPPPGKCVHCLTVEVERTWDHVFPRAWYPATTPRNVDKWQIPSCFPCNRDYGAMEDDLLCRIGLCLDPHAPDTAAIVQKALRSMKPEYGKNERDRAWRAKRAQSLRTQLLDGPDIPRSAVYPGLGERWGRPTTQGLGILVPAKSMQRLTEKIVRGICYLEDQRFIEPPQVIQFFGLTDEGAESVKVLLDRAGQEYAREPGILVRRASPEDDPNAHVFEITVWRQFTMYGTVS